MRTPVIIAATCGLMLAAAAVLAAGRTRGRGIRAGSRPPWPAPGTPRRRCASWSSCAECSAWPGNRTLAWTPETAFFALYDAATGQRRAAAGILSWLATHRTRLGELPEQVNARGHPASVVPLAWTDAIVLLALFRQGYLLPVPRRDG